MNDTKHTPGPWLLRDERFPDGIGSIIIELGIGETWLASVEGTHVGPKDRQECMANARLIAAAPELLEALKKLAMMARKSGGPAGPDAGLMEACEEAEAAIAKATGQAEKAIET